MRNKREKPDLDLSSNFDTPSLDDWKTLVEKSLKGASFDKALSSYTYDDIRIEPLYLPFQSSQARPEFAETLPVDRNIILEATKPNWDIRQIVASPSLSRCNFAIREDLQGGANSILLQIESPGRHGVRISNESDLEQILDSIEIRNVPIALDAGSNIWTVTDYFIRLWKSRGLSGEQVSGGLNIDPLGTLAMTGSLPINLEQASERLCATVSQFLSDWPNLTTFAADGRPYHNSGASGAQELAAIAATFVTYLRWLEDKGVSPSDAIDGAAVTVCANADFFQSIAKIRALRIIVGRIAEACGIAEKAKSITVNALSSEPMMTTRDVYVNMLRTTVACAAATIGGANSVSLLPFTWPMGNGDDFARRMARTTQLVLQKEAGLAMVADASGGSGYVETLTDQIARKSWTEFQAIEASGGMENALESGVIQKQIRDTARKRYDNIAKGVHEITGVTVFPSLDLENVGDVAPYSSVPEIDVEAITAEPLQLRRLSEPFEKLRDAADKATEQTGQRPAVFVVTLGDKLDHASRLTYSRNFFAAAGLDSIAFNYQSNIRELEAKFAESHSKVACLCGSDQNYETQSAELAPILKSAGALLIFQVGRPGEFRKDYRDAGIDDFVYPGCNMLTLLGSVIEAVYSRVDIDFY